jgi:hypothetical protein
LSADTVIDTLQRFAVEFWLNTAEMAPYLLLGFLVAGLLAAFISQRTVERHLGEGGFFPVVKATLFGVPLPLCSCGVIPVTASLRQHGASRAASTSFLLSTPQTGVDSILVTYSLLGPLFAVFRPIAALVTGVAGGLVVGLADRDATRPATAADATALADAEDGACADDCAVPTTTRRSLPEAFRYGFVDLPRDIGRALFVGLAIAALIGALVPQHFLGQFGQGLTGMLAMLLVGIPIYVCATGSVPIAAALMFKGVSPGAALVFLMTGPATNAAAITTIWKVLGRRTALIYLGTVVVGALLAGTILDLAFDMTGRDWGDVPHVMTIGWFETISAILLIAIVINALRPRGHLAPAAPAAPAGETTMEDRVKLSISGMSCSHCVNSVQRALGEADGVDDVRVDLDSGAAVVAGHDLEPPRLKQIVEQLGYTVTDVQPATA